LTHIPLPSFSSLQIPRLRPTGYATIAKHERTISRAYGGSRCAACTRQRILRAFIVEEHKIVRKMLSDKAKAAAGKA
jgi:large subunit ribosomal protein L34e